MGYAMRHPEPEKGGRGNKRSANGQFSGVPKQRVSEARAVLTYSREVAEQVVRGDKTLKAAFEEVRQSQGSDRKSKARLAMAVAKIYPEPEKAIRGKPGSVSEQQGVPKGKLSEARTVLRYAPDLADNVLSGAGSLDEAYRVARERKERRVLGGNPGPTGASPGVSGPRRA